MKPDIIISSHDFERLETLVDALPPASAGVRAALLEEIARAAILEPEEVPPSVVTMNSRVRFAVEPTAEEFSLTLSYPRDLAAGPGRISVLSPVGMAMLGLSVGGEIDWPGPGGTPLRVRILEVLYQPGSDGGTHDAASAATGSR